MLQKRCVPAKKSPNEKRDYRAGQHSHYRILKLRGPVCSKPGKHKKNRYRCSSDQLREPWGRAGKNTADHLSKTNAVKSNGNRLGKIQDNSNCAAKLSTQSTGYNVVDPANFYFKVCGNGRQRNTGKNRNNICEGNNNQRVPEAGIAHHISKAHEKDNTDDG